MRFRKKPVEIDAVQWAGNNLSEITEFMGHPPTWGKDINGPFIAIKTLEGTMHAMVGDWIIREPFPVGDREFYPCKPDIFEATYEPIGVKLLRDPIASA